MIIAGVDASLTATGVCVLDTETTTAGFNTWEVVTLKEPKLRGFLRLTCLCDRLEEVLSGVDMVFIEGYSFGSRGRGTISLGELGGAFRMRIGNDMKIPFCEVPPASLKKYITGKGNAPKQVMLEQTYRKFGIGSEALKNDNEVDAFCLARLGQNYIQWLEGGQAFTKCEIEVFKKLGKDPSEDKRK